MYQTLIIIQNIFCLPSKLFKYIRIFKYFNIYYSIFEYLEVDEELRTTVLQLEKRRNKQYSLFLTVSQFRIGKIRMLKKCAKIRLFAFRIFFKIYEIQEFKWNHLLSAKTPVIYFQPILIQSFNFNFPYAYDYLLFLQVSYRHLSQTDRQTDQCCVYQF